MRFRYLPAAALAILFVLATAPSCDKIGSEGPGTEAPDNTGNNGDNEDNGDNGNTGDNEDNGDNGNIGDNGGRTGYGWFELPEIVDANGDSMIDGMDQVYYASHFCNGKEKDPKGGTARNYTVCFSGTHHCPLWVAAPRHSMYVGRSGRNDSYRADPKIPAGIQYNSKSTGGGCNKGHMLGSAERTSSVETNRQVFYYSNIAPQYSSTFNTGGGAWNNLEDFVDGLVCRDTLYEVVGCYFDEYKDAYGITATPKKIEFGGRKDVSCPTMYYYALLRTKQGSSGKAVTQCQSSELQCVAFVLRHTMTKGHKPCAKDMISVAELERITGFRYFTNVQSAPKDSFNPSDWL